MTVDLIPDLDATYNIGSPSLRYKDGHLSGAFKVDGSGYFGSTLEVQDYAAFGNNAALLSAVAFNMQHDFPQVDGYGRWGAIFTARRTGNSNGEQGLNAFIATAETAVDGGSVGNQGSFTARAIWNTDVSLGGGKHSRGIRSDQYLLKAGNVDEAWFYDTYEEHPGPGRVQNLLFGYRCIDITLLGRVHADLNIGGFWAYRQKANATPTDRWCFVASDSLDRAAGVGQWGVREVGSSGLVMNLPVFSDSTRPTASAAGQGAVIYNTNDNGPIVSDGSNWRAPSGGWVTT